MLTRRFLLRHIGQVYTSAKRGRVQGTIGAVGDSVAAQLANRFYALDELSRIQKEGAAADDEITQSGNIVKQNEKQPRRN